MRGRKPILSQEELNSFVLDYILFNEPVSELAKIYGICYKNTHRYMGKAIFLGFIEEKEYLDAIRRKNSLAKSGKRNPNYEGKLLSEKVREKISVAMTGEKNHFYGKKHSGEAREKMHNAKLETVFQ